MAGAERVVLGFVAAQKTGKPAVLLDRMKLVAAAGKYLMRIGLVADVPDKPVGGRVENIMHRHRQLHRAETRPGMPADARARLDNKAADLVGHFLQVFDPQLAKVGG